MAAGTSSTFLGRTLPTRPGTSNGGRVAMMAGKKGVRVVVTVECTEQAESGVPGISRYTTQKSKRNTPGRLELMKYNKYLRRHTLHREIKKK
eukprot:jgi/Pico_ML_1/55714/g1364.t1